MLRVNIGCGMAPTLGWKNLDNSPSIRLSAFPIFAGFLHKARLINQAQMDLIHFCQDHKIVCADATRRIPLPDRSVEVLYSSHMIEHLDRSEARRFLEEAKRVLVPGGIIRLAVPDIERQVKKYAETGDADGFVEATHMCVPRPKSFPERLKALWVGQRHHHWMYDRVSLCKLLTDAEFKEATSLEPGQSRIPSPAPLNLKEREDESIYVEASNS